MSFRADHDHRELRVHLQRPGDLRVEVAGASAHRRDVGEHHRPVGRGGDAGGDPGRGGPARPRAPRGRRPPSRRASRAGSTCHAPWSRSRAGSGRRHRAARCAVARWPCGPAGPRRPSRRSRHRRRPCRRRAARRRPWPRPPRCGAPARHGSAARRALLGQGSWARTSGRKSTGVRGHPGRGLPGPARRRVGSGAVTPGPVATARAPGRTHMQVHDSVVDLIGGTPLVRLSSVTSPPRPGRPAGARQGGVLQPRWLSEGPHRDADDRGRGALRRARARRHDRRADERQHRRRARPRRAGGAGTTASSSARTR